MHAAAAGSPDPAPNTRKSLIQRLGHNWDDQKQEPLDQAQWRRDVDDFATSYRLAIVAVCLVLSRDAVTAEQLADQFLSDLTLNPAFLRKFDPELRFRCYLHGWLRHRHGALRRQELSLEHRRGVELDESSPMLATPTFLEQLEEAEAPAWHRAVAQIALASYAQNCRSDSKTNPAWVLSRHYGVPLPVDPQGAEVRLSRPSLAAAARLSPDALDDRLWKYRRTFRKHLAAAIDDLAGSPRARAIELAAFEELLPPIDRPPGTAS